MRKLTENPKMSKKSLKLYSKKMLKNKVEKFQKILEIVKKTKQ